MARKGKSLRQVLIVLRPAKATAGFQREELGPAPNTKYQDFPCLSILPHSRLSKVVLGPTSGCVDPDLLLIIKAPVQRSLSEQLLG